MKISEVSQKYGISIQTLHYYEREGIIPPVHRRTNGIRDYSDYDLKWIHYIHSLRKAGVSLKRIKEYVRMVEQGSKTREQRLNLLKEQLNELDDKIDSLIVARDWLKHKIDCFDLYKEDLENKNHM